MSYQCAKAPVVEWGGKGWVESGGMGWSGVGWGGVVWSGVGWSELPMLKIDGVKGLW